MLTRVVPKYLGTLDFDIYHVIVNNECWFSGKGVGDSLGYTCPTKARRDIAKINTETTV